MNQTQYRIARSADRRARSNQRIALAAANFAEGRQYFDERNSALSTPCHVRDLPAAFCWFECARANRDRLIAAKRAYAAGTGSMEKVLRARATAWGRPFADVVAEQKLIDKRAQIARFGLPADIGAAYLADARAYCRTAEAIFSHYAPVLPVALERAA